MDYNEIIEIFKYSSSIRKQFEYIDRYSELIEECLKKNKLNKDQLLRFMLMGFFIDYRAANHKGETFNTIEKNFEEFEKSQSIIDEMLINFTAKYSEKISKDDISSNRNQLKENFILLQKKNSIFNRLNGNSISDTNEYINLIKINDFGNDIGLNFFNFVING